MIMYVVTGLKKLGLGGNVEDARIMFMRIKEPLKQLYSYPIQFCICNMTLINDATNISPYPRYAADL